MADKKPLILAIDDTPANLLMLGMALKEEFDLQIATSGASGLTLAEQSRPDLILLDIMMPDMDGFETCRRLKANPVLCDIPVVFVSALTEMASESNGFDLGAADYITKPVNVEIARHRIRNLIDREALRKDVVAQRDQLQAHVAELKAAQVVLQQTQVTLAHSEAHLRAIILNEPECIKVVDAQGCLVQMNPAGLAMIEADSLVQVAGQPILNVIAAEHHVAFSTMHQRVLAGESVELAFEVQGLKGGRRWLETHAVPLQDKGQTVQLAVTRDITRRRQAEETLKQQMRFVEAHNQVAQAIIDGQNASLLLQKAATVVGQALALDRVIVYQVSYEQRLVTALHEWLNPQHPALQPHAKPYPLDMFIAGATEIWQTRRYLTSHRDAVNPLFLADGSGDVLHQRMGIQSLLWYPFDWSEGACLMLSLNQLLASRQWTLQELDFLEALVRQVNVALSKLRLLEAQTQAQHKLQLAASVFTHAREGITITTPEGTIVDVNDAFTRITGYAREEVLGKNPRILNSGRHGKEFYANVWQQLSDQGHWYGEIWNRRKNGELYPEMLTITAARDAHGKVGHYVALFSDITAYKAHEDQLEHIAHYDALTNLPNRVLLADRLRQGMAVEQRRGKKLAVVYLDLDGFKAVNDTHGHEAGDLLLITLTARMKHTLREGDTLARIGGDEFVAVLGDLEDANASVPMLTRLLSAAAESFTINGSVLQVSASVGVTCYPQAQDVEADQLVRQADQAMYQAKLAGKNRYSFFDTEQDSGIRSLHLDIERIRQGLAGEEFVLYYQPKVNMRTGAVIGAEALIRWQRPGAGLLVPGHFLPTIENHPLAVELGGWVIEAAVTQMETWQAQGLNLCVSVNVGARQLQHADFVLSLQKILAAHPKVMPSRLEIEILETSALEDLARVSQVIEACRELGVTFAMDDFGTGYSSLTYLRHLRVNLLKIDQSFVRDMLDDADDLAILQGVIGLAKAFGREVIAEGVETVAHGVLLLQLGCELAQGYCIARPMPAQDMAAWQRDWKPDPAWTCDSSPYQGRRSPE